MTATEPATAAARLLDDADLRFELEAVRVAALMRSLGREPGEDAFNLRRVQRNLVALNRAARRQVRASGANPDVTRLALFLAQSYEQLVGINDAADTGVKMAAAVNYELAGYQANAATLARQAVNTRALPADVSPTIEQLASLFLQRRFLRCSKLPTLVEPLEAPHGEFELGADTVLTVATTVAAQGVAAAAGALLNGDSTGFESAAADLEIARGAMLDVGFAPQSSILEGLTSLLPGLEERSIWTRLLPTLPDSALWRRYLSSLGRGLVGANPLDLRSISELWPSQQTAVDSNLLGGGSRVVRMPTSAGKTRVAEMFILHALATQPGSKALYIAPFNALTTEVTASFNDLFVDLGLSISSLTGTYEESPFESDVDDDDLLIVTPEKMDQLLRSNSEFLDHVAVVVLDEGHIVGEQSRGPKYELAISRLRRRRPEAAFLALSAVVPNETLEDFSAWLKSTRAPISTEWKPTKTRIARLDWNGEAGNLVYLDGPGTSALQVPNVIESQRLEYRHPATGRLRRPVFPESGHRAQVAAAMAWQMIQQGPVLIYCATPPYAQSVAAALGTRVEVAAHRGERVPGSLGLPASHSVLVAEEWLGADHNVTRLLRAGIGVHYSALPEAVRAAVEDDFRTRRLAVLAATPTLAQGVNLPVRTLIVHSTRRYDESEGSIRLPARDFWNVAGRVGRAGAETEGTVVFLRFNSTDQSDLDYYVYARDAGVEPVESALSKMLTDLLQQRISSDEIARQLNADMLALLVEEGDQTLSAGGLKSVIGDSLFQIQADRANRSPAIMWDLMAATSRSIVEKVPEAEQRAVFATTGLSAPSCQALEEHIALNALALNELKEVDDGASARRLILKGLTGSREMTPRNLDVGYADVLEGWIEGASVSDLAEEHGVDAVQLTSFIEDFFGYKLPWGMSGYLRIAQHALNWERVPDHLASLPLLVRYGVPNIHAAWLMSLGTPSRSVALRLALQFAESSRTQDIRGLRKWLSNLNLEDVSAEFGSAPGRLEAASRMITRADGNRLLRAYYAGAALLPMMVSLRLRFREGAEDIRTRLIDGRSPVHVRRDYDAPYRNAMRVHIGNLKPIRLRREYADALALEQDAGRELETIVVAVTRKEQVLTLELSVRETTTAGAAP